jgi:hypothetical protein
MMLSCDSKWVFLDVFLRFEKNVGFFKFAKNGNKIVKILGFSGNKKYEKCGFSFLSIKKCQLETSKP